MHTKRRRAVPSPVRVRQEPPTEAVAAAQALTPDLEHSKPLSVRINPSFFDDRFPFSDLGLEMLVERRRRDSLLRDRLSAEAGEALDHLWALQCDLQGA